MTIEYELDQWEWQGTTQSVDISLDDFEGMSDEEIAHYISDIIEADGRSKMHFVYQEGEIVREIKEALATAEEEAA